jgi:aspartate--ammonia ligase
MFIRNDTSVNEDLNGIEKPVSFSIKDLNGIDVEIVQSLAKWKRITLADLG